MLSSLSLKINQFKCLWEFQQLNRKLLCGLEKLLSLCVSHLLFTDPASCLAAWLTREEVCQRRMYTTFAFVFIFTLVSGGFVKEPSNVVYKRGEQTIGHISCEVSPADLLTLLWQFQSYNSQASVIIYYNGTIVHNREKYSISNNAVKTGNFTITINNLERNDSGEYTCQVDGMARKATLYVAGKSFIPTSWSPRSLH